MQSESFLSYQRSLEEGRKTSNCHTLFGMAKIPTDNHIRSMLDPVHPSHLQSSFDQVIATLRARGGMKEFERLGGRALIALDGTEYFCSQKLGCPQCQTRKRSNGKTEFYHSMLAATLVAPGHNMVVPLMPEFIAKPDGAEKQDCERNAAKRWLAAHGARMKELRPVYLGDDLFACQPICDAVLASGADFPACARARWKIENETFNILKNNGYHLEHNFGHGKQTLAMLFTAMNLLAFAMPTVCDCLEDLWGKAREAKRSRKRFFEHIRTITAYLVFPDWWSLMTTLINSKPPPEIEKQIAG